MSHPNDLSAYEFLSTKFLQVQLSVIIKHTFDTPHLTYKDRLSN